MWHNFIFDYLSLFKLCLVTIFTSFTINFADSLHAHCWVGSVLLFLVFVTAKAIEDYFSTFYDDFIFWDWKWMKILYDFHFHLVISFSHIFIFISHCAVNIFQIWKNTYTKFYTNITVVATYFLFRQQSNIFKITHKTSKKKIQEIFSLHNRNNVLLALSQYNRTQLLQSI